MLIWTTAPCDPATDYFSVLSTQGYGRVVSAKNAATGYPVTISGASVSLAFVAPGATPGSGDWKTAAWAQDTSMAPPTTVATIVLGPSNLVLTAGPYDVWAKVTYSSTETFVAKIDEVTVA